MQLLAGTFIWIGVRIYHPTHSIRQTNKFGFHQNLDLGQLVEKTAYRVVSEKYDSKHPDLPIVKLWDNLQQGVGVLI